MIVEGAVLSVHYEQPRPSEGCGWIHEMHVQACVSDDITVPLSCYRHKRILPKLPDEFSPMANRASDKLCLFLQLGFLSGLTGDIPPGLSKMQQLGYLDVAGNMLTGPLPAVTSVNMINLRLAENFLTGTIPASYGEHL